MRGVTPMMRCLFLLGIIISLAQGFLEDELPLELVSASPFDINVIESRTGFGELSGSDSLQAVFSRPVVALGSDFGQEALPLDKVPFTLSQDIPGRLYWVTSYIARFDLEGNEWPFDLDLTLTWNTELTTYDGVKVKWSDDQNLSVQLRTSSMYAYCWDDNVQSLLGLYVTNGRWSGAELLPDAKVRWSFGGDVSLPLVQNALKIFTDAGQEIKDVGIIVESCLPGGEINLPDGQDLEDDCLIMSLDGELERNTRYQIKFPEGSVYTTSGTVKRTTNTCGIDGPKNFYLFDVGDRWETYVDSRRIQFLLNHGLSPDNTIQDVKKQITILATDNDPENDNEYDQAVSIIPGSELDFNLTLLDKGLAMLSANFFPWKTYVINVEGTDKVRDAFGFPLMSQQVKLQMDSAPKFLTTPLDEGVYTSLSSNLLSVEEASEWKGLWPVITSGTGHEYEERIQSVSYWLFPVDEQLIEDVLVVCTFSYTLSDYQIRRMQSSDKSSLVCNNLQQYLGEPAYVVEADGEERTSLQEIDLGDLLDSGSGLVVQQQCCVQGRLDDVETTFSSPTKVIMKRSLSAYVMYQCSTATAAVVVWNLHDATPATDTQVLLYKVKSYGSEPTSKIGSSITDSNGFAKFEDVAWQAEDDEFAAVIKTSDGKLVMLDSLRVQGRCGSEEEDIKLEGKLIVDHKLVRPEEGFYAVGYVRQLVADSWEIPDQDITFYLEFEEGFTPGGLSRVELQAERETGSFVVALKKAEDMKPGSYSIDLKSETSPGKSITLDSIQVVGADPRAPTARLTVTAPAWATPTSTFQITMQTDSYIGASLSDQQIQVQWAYYSDIQEEDIENSFTVTTDKDGRAIADIDLSILAGDIEVGRTFRLDFEYIGPVRECLTDARSITIRDSELSISLSTSLDSVQMPAIEFGVVADVDSTDKITGDTEIIDAPVDIQLIRADGEVESSCSISSKSKDYSKCRVVLQQATNYTLSGCVTDSLEVKVCDTKFLGSTPEKYEQEPLSSFKFSWRLLQSKALHTQGEEIDLLFENPIPESTLVLYSYSDLGSFEQVYTNLSAGLQSIPFKIDSYCYQNCHLLAALIAPRRKSFELPEMPISKFFDPAAPTYFSYDTFINVAPPSSYVDINLLLSSLSGPQNSSISGATPIVVEPEEPVRLDVTSMLGRGDANVDAEVIVFVVDRSILDVVPTPIVNVSDMVSVDLSGDAPYYKFLGGLVQKGDAFDIARDFFLQVNAHDPWLVPPLTVFPQPDLSNRADVLPADKGFARFLEDNYAYFNWFDSSQRPVPSISQLGDSIIFLQQASAADDESTADRDLDKIGEGVKQKEFRYLATPVQAILQTGEDGKAVIAFKAPINLGRFNIRAYAATENNQFGVAELDFIVRRTISLTLSVPRQVRTQDTFQAGVIITISPNEVTYFDDEVITVEITAQPTGEIMAQDKGDLTATVAVVVGVPVEVGFQFGAQALGEGEIKFSASDARGSTDSRKATIPVNGQQAPVAIASSFAIQGSVQGGGSWQEGLVLPEAVEGSGTIDVSAGVGRLPAIQTFTDALMSDLSDDDPNSPSAAKAIASLVLDSVLSTYNSVSEEVSSASYNAMNDLTRLTKESNGLCWYIPSYFTAVSISLNAWALWATSEASVLKQLPSAVQNLKVSWQENMLQELIEDAEYYREEQDWRGPMAYPGISTLASVKLAVGVEWSPTDTSDDVINDLSTVRLYNAFFNSSDMHVGTQVDIALLAQQDNVNAEAANVVSQVSKNVLGGISVRGRTAYVTFRRGSTSPADLETQAKCLLLLLRTANGDNPLVEKLANYIGSQNAYAYTTVAVALSLAEYDKVRGSTDPDLQLDVRSGNVTMLNALFKNSGDALKTSTSFDSLDNPPQPIEFKAVGAGEVSLAALLDFIPSVLFPFPQYRGIFVERVIQGSNSLGEATGAPLGVIPLRSVVNYVIQLSTPFDVGAAEIQVLMPGGLEPIDPNVPTCQPNGNEICYAGRNGLSFLRYFYPACPKMEVYPDKVIFSYAYMRAGTHDISFKAIAATKGDFVLPPVQAFSIEEPEIMGLSSSGELNICEDCEFVSLDALSSLPISCKNDCNGFGVCNVNKGECICNQGSTGEDCSALVVS
eukprot:TRINITY_DN5527_c0_g1_i3.p1 TRINITY_DN5527_c0_g1~~TRINITY_DN5527_c0_g1_i3.p1  ORF type:complete len:2117 (+),score=423.13 TRINITY_DN5527_c0_g1_i3:248-6598(+)